MRRVVGDGKTPLLRKDDRRMLAQLIYILNSSKHHIRGGGMWHRGERHSRSRSKKRHIYMYTDQLDERSSWGVSPPDSGFRDWREENKRRYDEERMEAIEGSQTQSTESIYSTKQPCPAEFETSHRRARPSSVIPAQLCSLERRV